MVGCRPEAGCQALKRTPGHRLAGAPVAVIGMRRPLQVMTWRPGDEAVGLDLQPLDRGIDVAHRAAAAALFAQHMPGLERLAQFQLDAAVVDLAEDGKAEFALRLEPVRLESVAGVARGRRARPENPPRRNAAA